MAIGYRIVKYCNICKKRFLVEKGQQHIIYCDTCYEKITKNAKQNIA
ncbi:MAG: hypothetical protein ABIG95_02965 [Candidatus Woesearchaeota archaeon]